MITRLENIIRHNFLKKVIAVIVASVLWVFVMDDQNPVIEGSYTVPLAVTGVSPEYRAIYQDQQVKIKLRAPRSYFVNYGNSDFRAFVNMANYVEGTFDVETEASYPQGFELISTSPEIIRVKLDPIIEKQMPVDIIVTGSLPEGQGVKSITKSSENVTVVGPRTAVESVTRVIGYAGLSNNTEDFNLQTSLTAINEDGRTVSNVRIVPSAINVFVDIETNIIKKSVPVTAEITVPSGWEISNKKIEPETLELSGTKENLDKVASLKIPVITIQPGPQIYKKTFNVEIPDGVMAMSNDVVVTVEIRKKLGG